MSEPLQLIVIVIAIFGCGGLLYSCWIEADEVDPGAGAARSCVPTSEHPAVVVDALDARIHVSDDGVTFEHARSRASGRRRDAIVFAPWSSIVGAMWTAKEIRVQVAGYCSPRAVSADPWGASLKHGHESVAGAIVAVIWSRAAGAEAVPILATVNDQPGARRLQ